MYNSEWTGEQIDWGVGAAGVVEVTIPSGSTYASNANITAEHVVVRAVVANPAAQTGNWTWTTSAGRVDISGSGAGGSAVTLYLAKKRS